MKVLDSFYENFSEIIEKIFYVFYRNLKKFLYFYEKEILYENYMRIFVKLNQNVWTGKI